MLFAASLLWFAYCYLVRFGRPAPPGSVLAPVLVDLVLFSVFALHHSVLARSGAKQRSAPDRAAELERSLYTWVASLLFLAVCTWWQPVPGVLYQLHGPWRAGAWAAQVAGILLTLWASRALDVLDLAGVRAVLGSGASRRRPQSVRRSPRTASTGSCATLLYFAWALFVFTTPTMTGTRAAFAVISTAYLMLAIPWEERGLVETFGQEYEAYRRSVRTRMIPWVY